MLHVLGLAELNLPKGIQDFPLLFPINHEKHHHANKENLAEEGLGYLAVLTCFNLAATNLSFSLLPSSLTGTKKAGRILRSVINEESLQGQSSYEKLLTFQMFPSEMVLCYHAILQYHMHT